MTKCSEWTREGGSCPHDAKISLRPKKYKRKKTANNSEEIVEYGKPIGVCDGHARQLLNPRNRQQDYERFDWNTFVAMQVMES